MIDEYFAETLIVDLKKKVSKLEEELAQAKIDVKDFEDLARVWKKGWEDTERDYKRRLGNAEQTIKQLEKDLERAEEQIRYDSHN